MSLIELIGDHGVFEAVPVSLAAAVFYLIIRVILVKNKLIARKTPVSEAAGVLLAGYIAALFMIECPSAARAFH